MPKSAVQSPGSVLQSLMDEYQLNPGQLGQAVKLSLSAVRQVVIGQTRITVPAALRYARYFGTTPEYWLDLQTKYDLAEAAKDSELTALLKSIPKAKKPAPVKSAPQKTAKPAAPAKKAPPKKLPVKPKP